ncbi:NAD(P)H-dependent oxidoreductase [Lacticaseibacillus daqingensis]|uniref:NAD(P)H-dependent oxidoreductase n=1 Tax=Lacticaseibacillus daqingensis TaxID=2486014 RepID=UPI000F79273E|nr:NAD(P)H-dependent oxidoreductase [Lacticaseibacillus daqingensis]
MKTLVIVSHPDVAGSLTQQFLKASAARLPEVTWHVLPAMLDVAAEQVQLLAADRIVLAFPLYWYQAPASLKAWLDAVWTDALAAKLAGRDLGLVVTFSQPEAAYQAGGAEGVSLSTLLSPYAALARKTGLRLLPTLTVPQFAYQDEAARAQLLVRYQQYLTLETPQSFSAQAAWWMAQLDRRGQADPLAPQTLMAATLAERQEQLTALRATIQAMKAGERDDG